MVLYTALGLVVFLLSLLFLMVVLLLCHCSDCYHSDYHDCSRSWYFARVVVAAIVTTWSGAHRWPYVFLDFGYFVPRFTMCLGFFLPNLFETPFFVSLEQSQNKFDKRCRISAGLFPLRSTLNTGYITGLDTCKVCTEAVHCVPL